MSNYTVIDLIGTSCGVILFIPLMIAPGYVAAWFTEALGFRKLSVPWRVLASVPLSIALCPILTYWVGSVFGWIAIWVFYGLAAVICLILLCGMLGHERARIWLSDLWRTPRVSWFIAGAWLVIALFSLVDLQIGDRLYFSVTAYDHSVRTAITDAISRTGVKPENPFYCLGSPAPLRYHYFWFIGCSLVALAGGHIVNSRLAIIASVVWCGWAFAAVVPLFLRFVFGMSGHTLRRAAIVAVCLTTVTGLDILPTLYLWTRGTVYADMEWWNNQITSWWGSGLWVPHHLAGLVVALASLILLWHAASETNNKLRVKEAILAGIGLATMVGTSIYVALVVAAFLALWIIVTWLTRDRRHSAVVLIAGVVTLVLLVPYLLALAHSGGGSGGSGSVSLLKPTVREFGPLDLWMQRHPVNRFTKGILRALLLPLNYFLELGLFLVAGCMYLRKHWKSRSWELHLRFTGLLAATSIVVCTFWHSSVISNNDLGTRGFLPAQFVLLLWTADLLISGQLNIRRAPAASSSWARSPLWASLIVLGAMGTFYELGLLRFEGLLADNQIIPLYFSPDHELGQRTCALRNAYDQLRTVSPKDAVIQNNPNWNYTDYFYGLYADRQTAAYDRACGSEFGGSVEQCQKIFPQIAAVFSDHHNVRAADVAELSRRLNIRAVLVKDLDACWKDRQSWAWQVPPAISNHFVRIYFFHGSESGASDISQYSIHTPR